MPVGSKSLHLLMALIAVNGRASQPTLRSSVNGFIQQHVSIAIEWLGEPTDQLALTDNPVTWQSGFSPYPPRATRSRVTFQNSGSGPCTRGLRRETSRAVSSTST
jgi:hypothetical protein